MASHLTIRECHVAYTIPRRVADMLLTQLAEATNGRTQIRLLIRTFVVSRFARSEGFEPPTF